MAFRLPASNSEIAENIKKAKEKIIQVYDMLPNFCLNEGKLVRNTFQIVVAIFMSRNP